MLFKKHCKRIQEHLPKHYGHGKLHLAFEAPEDEYDNLLAQVKDLEIEITHQHTWDNGKRSFYFDDPDGHSLEIVEPGMWD